MRRPRRVFSCALALAGLIWMSAGFVAYGRAAAGPAAAAQAKTAKDGVYAKTQAEAGKAAFDKLCTPCHRFAPWEKSDMNPDLGGAPFLAKWDGRPIRQLVDVIYQTMPNDGSAFLTDDQSVNLAAFILQQNGFPPGEKPLTVDAGDGKLLIVR